MARFEESIRQRRAEHIVNKIASQALSVGGGRLRCDLLSSTDAAGLEIEHPHAKVGVEGSNPFARSKITLNHKALWLAGR